MVEAWEATDHSTRDKASKRGSLKVVGTHPSVGADARSGGFSGTVWPIDAKPLLSDALRVGSSNGKTIKKGP